MANLSGYTPVYVRTSGNDSTGNGSSGSPYATAARAFRHAWLAGNTPTLPTRQITTIVCNDPAGGTADLTVDYYDGTGFATQTWGVISATDAADLASKLAADIGTQAEYSAVASGANLIVTSVRYGVCPDNTHGGRFLSFTNNAVSSQSLTQTNIAYVPATQGSGNYVLDFGAGSFGGVNLQSFWVHTHNAGAHTYGSAWPARIAVRGVTASTSSMGGITGGGIDGAWDSSGFPPFPITQNPVAGRSITIASDGTVNLGVITTVGGGWNIYGSEADLSSIPSTTEPGGAVTLTDCATESIASTGGNFSSNGFSATTGAGGAITLSGCTVTGGVTTAGGLPNTSGASESVGASGSITATDTVISGAVTSSGVSVSPNAYGNAAAGGSVTLTRCTVGGAVDAIGGDGNTTTSYDSYGGAGGAVSATDTIVGQWINTYGRNGYSNSTSAAVSGAGGNITLTRSRVGSYVNLSGGSTTGYFIGESPNGSLTMSGACILPTHIYNNTGSPFTIDISGLARGRGVNGSSILGVA